MKNGCVIPSDPAYRLLLQIKFLTPTSRKYFTCGWFCDLWYNGTVKSVKFRLVLHSTPDESAIKKGGAGADAARENQPGNRTRERRDKCPVLTSHRCLLQNCILCW